MHRLTYSVSAVRGGWHLREGDEVLQWFGSAGAALEAARNLAEWLFEARGIPTSVLLHDVGERPVLVAEHG